MLEIRNLFKTYTSKNGVSYRALENVSLSFDDHGMCFILGKSGSGKSTLLNMIGGLDKFDRGEIIFANHSFADFNEHNFEYYRNHCVGFVFQDFCLIDSLNVYDNVALSFTLQGKEVGNEVNEVLKQVGIYDIRYKKSNELTGGQKQKVAIARAIIKNPNIILADEPTGSLDSENSIEIMKLLKEFSKKALVIIVTHNKELAFEYADRVIEIRDGFILKDMARKEFSRLENNENMMYSSTLLVAKKGNKIKPKDIKEINNIIQEKRQDYYLYVSSNKNRVISMYPNLKEIFSHKKREEDFVPYKYVDDNYQIEIPAKSKGMKVNKALKFGSTLTRKRFSKFLLSIIISTISILVIGIIANFATYSFSDATVTLLNKEDMKFLNVTSSFTVSDPSYKLTDTDFDKIENLGLSYAKNYDYSGLKFKQSLMSGGSFSSDPEFNGALDGFSVIENYEDYGINIVLEKPSEDRTDEDNKFGIYISTLVADKMVQYIASIDTYEQCLTKKATILDIKCPIVGIFKSDDSYFNKRIIIDSSFMDNYFLSIKRMTDKLSAQTTNVYNTQSVAATQIIDVEEIKEKSPVEYVFFKDGMKPSDVYNLKENEIVVGRDFIRTLTGVKYSQENAARIKELIQKYNSENHTLTIKTNPNNNNGAIDEIYYSINNVQIVGMISKYSTTSSLVGVYIQHQIFHQVIADYNKPTSFVVSIAEEKDFDGLIKKLNDNGFVIKSHFAPYVLDVANTIGQYKSLFDIALVIWLVIVGILFYSFMSKSIKDSKRTIGILKALGIKGYDIYKIFIIEAITLGLISTILAIIAFIVGGNATNLLITEYLYTFYLPMFLVNPTIIIMMVVMPFVALSVALIIPISSANSIKPIEVMNRE